MVSQNVTPEVSGEQQNKGKGLYVALGVLCVVIVGLVIGIVVVNLSNNEESKQIAEEVEQDLDTVVEEKMSGWDGEVSDATKALVLAESIDEKLVSSPDYGSAQAAEEYREAYESASGDLKVYIAIKYAQYIYSTFDDLEQAVGILAAVDGQGSDMAKIDRLYALADLYERSGDQSTADHYRQKAIDDFPSLNVPYEGGRQ